MMADAALSAAGFRARRFLCAEATGVCPSPGWRGREAIGRGVGDGV